MERKEKSQCKKEAIEVDNKLALRDVLVNQTIYEFPTLVAVHHSLLPAYLNTRLTANPT